jgi:hypothetical protein
MDKVLKVPIVMYINGTRHVVGEVTVEGNKITGQIGERASVTVLSLLRKPGTDLSVSAYPSKERANYATR